MIDSVIMYVFNVLSIYLSLITLTYIYLGFLNIDSIISFPDLYIIYFISHRKKEKKRYVY
jgi:hypothetical protein